MTDSAFKISKQQVGVVLAWVGYIDQARIALQLEGGNGHEALCHTLQKAADAISTVLRELPPA